MVRGVHYPLIKQNYFKIFITALSKFFKIIQKNLAQYKCLNTHIYPKASQKAFGLNWTFTSNKQYCLI
jgi:hypothetical protein